MDFLSIMCPLGGRLVRTVARGRSRSILTDNFHTGLVPSTSPPSDLIARLALIHLYKCTFLVYSWTEICHIWRTGQKIKGTTGYQPTMIVIFVTKKKLRANYATLCCCVQHFRVIKRKWKLLVSKCYQKKYLQAHKRWALESTDTSFVVSKLFAKLRRTIH